MSNLLRQKNKLRETKIASPILMMLQAEQLKNRGCGSSDYNYIDYYYDSKNDIYYGFIDEVVITPDGGYAGEDDWEDEYLNNQGDDYADDVFNGTGGGGTGTGENSGNSPNNNQNVEAGNQFADDLQNGDVDLQLTSEILSFISTTISITGLLNTVADTIKQDIGLLGEMGRWLGGANAAYSGVSAIIGLTDGEQSPKDWINAGAAFFSAGSFFVPALGFVSVVLTVAACAAPGDQGNSIPGRDY